MIRRHHRRDGAAAVEMAVVMTFIMVPLMIGLWEMGRLVHVQQIVSNSAREGARLAAQGYTLDQNGNLTQISSAILPADNTADRPNIKAAVMQSLHGAGLTTLTWADVDVTFEFIASSPEVPGAVTGATEPYQGVKNQRIRVTVTIRDFDKVRWVNLGLVNPETVSYSADWRMMLDDRFQINTTIPTPPTAW